MVTVLSLGALTGAAVVAITLSCGSRSWPIGLGLQSYTNGSAVVTLTNLSRRKVDYVWVVERRTAHSWPKYEHNFPVGIDSRQIGILKPRQVSELAVPVMVYAPPCPWRVSVFCYRNPAGPNTARGKAGLWFMRHGMARLARKAIGEFRSVQVPGPEMEQLEK
jgi:hypothetical protein